NSYKYTPGKFDALANYQIARDIVNEDEFENETNDETNVNEISATDSQFEALKDEMQELRAQLSGVNAAVSLVKTSIEDVVPLMVTQSLPSPPSTADVERQIDLALTREMNEFNEEDELANTIPPLPPPTATAYEYDDDLDDDDNNEFSFRRSSLDTGNATAMLERWSNIDPSDNTSESQSFQRSTNDLTIKNIKFPPTTNTKENNTEDTDVAVLSIEDKV
ncbi:hypothetical protein ScalyP_jg545, partial [Parmales sp. scaly parma]